ncbi:hypothetical protein HELRODRAFT_182851 [Helobdella robusta]|uniref:Uncharacterized protein n=1 Tax=Helobdella robusta TaxID=6412 RepID=T1FIV1_HELRO|nr:hypothetical protein HELRODRAFT_182851 [Helobdella robusta]ESN90059.1 hypothetical protein HELRODRAFT_182851 [Helobdella robusta]
MKSRDPNSSKRQSDAGPHYDTPPVDLLTATTINTYNSTTTYTTATTNNNNYNNNYNYNSNNNIIIDVPSASGDALVSSTGSSDVLVASTGSSDVLVASTGNRDVLVASAGNRDALYSSVTSSSHHYDEVLDIDLSLYDDNKSNSNNNNNNNNFANITCNNNKNNNKNNNNKDNNFANITSNNINNNDNDVNNAIKHSEFWGSSNSSSNNNNNNYNNNNNNNNKNFSSCQPPLPNLPPHQLQTTTTTTTSLSASPSLSSPSCRNRQPRLGVSAHRFTNITSLADISPHRYPYRDTEIPLSSTRAIHYNQNLFLARRKNDVTENGRNRFGKIAIRNTENIEMAGLASVSTSVPNRSTCSNNNNNNTQYLSTFFSTVGRARRRQTGMVLDADEASLPRQCSVS